MYDQFWRKGRKSQEKGERPRKLRFLYSKLSNAIGRTSKRFIELELWSNYCTTTLSEFEMKTGIDWYRIGLRCKQESCRGCRFKMLRGRVHALAFHCWGLDALEPLLN
ncbi:hypothetical protein MTR_5g075365 [Medicago truncatula]|uniref:Uncharacterized protein n=1 Tax=Medicago truncatula TaxID=3880 RepID=A0A072UEU6_MEDTR|nr:hypothetical protein MTR_5g075365 [Medicago truncatula]